MSPDGPDVTPPVNLPTDPRPEEPSVPTSRRNPFEGVTDFVTELGRLHTLGIHGSEHGVDTPGRTRASAWVPATDILARGDDLVIRVELAGVDPDDVDLGFQHEVLTVSGSRHTADAADTEFYVRERHHGEFRRVITLPRGTRAEDLRAEFADGLVEVTVRGAAAPGDSTRIEVVERSRGTTSRPVTATDDD